ncbi:hypothetical protein J6590_040340 [Homalodisca vitripennis]|nr:hypothetical protein J6590_040340 [Homalodisca vitripennis]
MTLKNINTLRLISDMQEFVWPISTINLINILDMDLGSSLLKMFAEHVVITKTKVKEHYYSTIHIIASLDERLPHPTYLSPSGVATLYS